MKPTISFLFLAIVMAGCTYMNKTTVKSPDGELKVIVFQGKKNLSPDLILQTGKGKEILRLNLLLESVPGIFDKPFRITGSEKKKVSDTWINDFGERREVPDNYTQATLKMASGIATINLIIRAYNEGVAFCWEVPHHEGIDSLTITDEKILFRFPSDHFAWSAPRAQSLYSHVPLSGIDKGAACQNR